MMGIFIAWTDNKHSPGYIVQENGCHTWLGCQLPLGYGRVSIDGAPDYAHRVRYEREIGPIPEGMELDHICRNAACCNPQHLEPVTHRENVLRGNSPTAANALKTHCSKGHPLSGDNLCPYNKKRGYRTCLICKRERNRIYWKRRMAA